jgi:hypothetical protein
VPPYRVTQGFICLNDTAKLFRGGANTPVGMITARQYPLSTAYGLLVRIYGDV